jgi:hypothetical protein
LVYQLYQTIMHHFPELFAWLREIEDCRKKASNYELAALLMACLAMFLFKTESRNAANNLREDLRFQKNYKRLFKCKMPHMDTVDRVMRLLDPSSLELLKQRLVQTLLRRKTFHKQRYRNKWFTVAIDATGVMSYDHENSTQCLHKTSKNGHTTWFHNVLEARLVTSNGFSISLLTEWIENPSDTDYDKQDCERKAFIRLATRLKQAFPRLPILLLADGLYPYDGFFSVCRDHGWSYIVTFKEGNLPSVWEEVQALRDLQKHHQHRESLTLPNQSTLHQQFRWVTQIDYKGHTVNWIECQELSSQTTNDGDVEEKRNTFTHLTDLPVNARTITRTSQTGRLRWKIENEGFNTLKNGGYALTHKYSRVSYQATKNYYQMMQIAHMIHQLMIYSTRFQDTYLKAKNHPTIKALWQQMIAALCWASLDKKQLRAIRKQKCQFRFIT